MKFFIARLVGLSIVFVLSTSVVRGQFVYIPDSAFRSFLISDGFAPAFNGDSLDSTSVMVTTTTVLNCSGWGIHSLEGIQYFDQLTDLNCNVNYLSTLPQLPATLNARLNTSRSN